MKMEVRLKDIARIINGGTPSTRIEEYWNGDIPWITPKDLSRYEKVYISCGERNITTEGLNNSSAQLLPKNTILFSSRAPIGYVAIAANEVTTNQGFKNLICNKEIVDYKYLYYWLKRHAENIKGAAIGSTFAEVSKSEMENLQLTLPPLSEQKRIANILSSFDNKIEILKKENKILEDIAENIFKEWFVKYNFPNKDGKPYRDSGGKMIDSELGPIPEGWRVGKLGEIFDFLEGPGIRNWQYRPKGFPFINIRLFTNNHELDTRNSNFISLEEAEGKYKHFHLEEKDFVVSTSGTLGKYAIVQEKDLPLMLNTSVIRFRPQRDIPYSFMYLYLSSNIFLHELESLASGSVQLNFGPMHLRQIQITIPNVNTLQTFGRAIDKVYEKILGNRNSIKSNTSIKEMLLTNIIN